MLGIGDVCATAEIGMTLKTIGLGSCIAVILLDPSTQCVAMAHIALPDSSISPERGRTKPGYFADTGIPALFAAAATCGWNPANRDTMIKMVGGASVLDPNNTFNIGKRNILAIKKVLWDFGMGAVAEDLGGRISRTVTVDVETGNIQVSSPGRESWII